MKYTAIFIIATFGCFTLFYLMGSFIENSFNISYWSSGCRGLIGAFGGFSADNIENIDSRK